MILGIGTDICRIERVETGLARFGDRFLHRVLTPAEREGRWGARQLARRWAMKEAVAKATGWGIGAKLSFQDIEIMRDDLGKPVCHLKGFEDCNVMVSVSDDGEYASGFAVIEKL
ncbi:MAG: holo-[acyl-carrier-protein] synthase [Alphaproteobacteria bacterium]|nr:MAG: holo-[acyl-carrier-protein] synthase [Alphaproteobacteria bacterium]